MISNSSQLQNTDSQSDLIETLEANIHALQKELEQEKDAHSKSKNKLEAVKKMLLPQYKDLQKIFSEIGEEAINETDSGVYDIWKEKLGKQPLRMLELFIKKKKITRKQLGILTGLKYTSGSFAQYISILTSANLIKREGDAYVLQPIS